MINANTELVCYSCARKLDQSEALARGGKHEFICAECLTLHYADYPDAEIALIDGLRKAEASAPVSDNVGRCLNALAMFYKAQGRYEEAEPLYKRAIAVTEQALGASHRHLAITLDGYASLLRLTHREAEASELEAQTHAIFAGSDTNRETLYVGLDFRKDD